MANRYNPTKYLHKQTLVEIECLLRKRKIWRFLEKQILSNNKASSHSRRSIRIEGLIRSWRAQFVKEKKIACLKFQLITNTNTKENLFSSLIRTTNNTEPQEHTATVMGAHHVRHSRKVIHRWRRKIAFTLMPNNPNVYWIYWKSEHFNPTCCHNSVQNNSNNNNNSDTIKKRKSMLTASKEHTEQQQQQRDEI